MTLPTDPREEGSRARQILLARHNNYRSSIEYDAALTTTSRDT